MCRSQICTKNKNYAFEATEKKNKKVITILNFKGWHEHKSTKKYILPKHIHN